MGCGASAGTPDIFKAVEAGDVGAVQSIIVKDPGRATKPKNAEGDTVLHHAAYKEPGGKAACLQVLLQAPGADRGARNGKGLTPLHVAAVNGKDAAMRELLRAGARCDATDPEGMTPLGLATRSSFDLCVQAALDCKVDPNLLDGKKQTPLHIASRTGHTACVRALLAGSATVNLATPDSEGGWTPLHEAAKGGHKDVIESLLKAKADTQIRNTQGSTAMDLAAAGGFKALAQRLGSAVKEEDIEAGRAVVAAGGGDVVEGDPEGLLPAIDATRVRLQDMMDVTWKGVTTRDRGYGKVFHFEVVHVLQNSNKALWDGYQECCANLALHYVKQVTDVKTVVESWESGLQDPRKTGINEFFLFHGTKPTAATSICKGGFNVDLSGENKGSLYGPGIYLAESSAKADEYAEDDKDGAYVGLFAMLLCRASLGNPLVNEEVQPDTEEIRQQMQAGDKHSIIGDREKVRGTYREFIIREPRQVYPAYVIIYRRKQG